jgi:hypothetical protein
MSSSYMYQIGQRLYHRDMHGVCFRFLHLAYSRDVYDDRAVVVEDNFIGAVAVAVFRFIERHYQWVARHDRESLDVNEGEQWPWWSGTWWLFLPYRISNKYFFKIDLYQFE